MAFLKCGRPYFYVWPSLGSPWGRVGPWSTGMSRHADAEVVEAWLRELPHRDPRLLNALAEGDTSLRAAWTATVNGRGDGLPRRERRPPAFKHPMEDWFEHEPQTDIPPGGGVYVLYAPAADLYKIGFTSNFRKRIRSLRNASPVALEVRALMHGWPRMHEARAHIAFDQHRAHGEWFRACPEIEAWLDGAS